MPRRGDSRKGVCPLLLVGDKRVRLQAIGKMNVRTRTPVVIGVGLKKIVMMVIDDHMMTANNVNVGFYRGLTTEPCKADGG